MTLSEEEVEEILRSVGAREDFFEVSLSIDHSICRLGECKLCLDHCPTQALFQAKQVEIIPQLCTGCGSCILLCMVPGCMKLKRKRKDDGKEEILSTPEDVLLSVNADNHKKRNNLLNRIIES